MLIFHTSLFFTLLIFALLIFQTDLYSSLWATGPGCPYGNDSWKFIANSLNPTHPPYPYHPIAVSLHYLVLYSIFSPIMPSIPAMTLAVLIVQFIASLSLIYLLYHFFLESFHLDTREGLILVVFYDFIFISPFLLLAVSEILFLLYQVLAWTFLIRHRYFSAAIATAMTFAIRFNGAFFVISIFLVIFLEWLKSKTISLKRLVTVGISIILMFIIGFSSFILSWFVFGDFWVPLASQREIYQLYQGYAAESVFSLPFLWWPIYFQWVVQSNSIFELVYFIMAIITLGFGFLSFWALFKWSREENSGHQFMLLLIFICGFLGVNLIVSGSNFSRFLSFVFPVFPVFPLWLRGHKLSSFHFSILLFLSGIWGLLFNIIWWMSYPDLPCI